ncbi:MAG: flavodoxin domain-containing protein [Planctomycetes bacterium]|nr:flavodoxin domain-containing protein [Planctomycetota bacterium]
MEATVLYFSSSGKTSDMAARLTDCLRRLGCKVLATSLDEARESDLGRGGMLFVGSPAWSGEQVVPALDEFVRDHVERLAGARVAFFGSYDWGDGLYFDALAEFLRGKVAAVHAKPLLSKLDEPSLSDEVVATFAAEVLAEASLAAERPDAD